MFTAEECEQLYLKKLRKSTNELSSLEEAILVTVISDNARGRYSKFLMWTSDDRNSFLNWLNQLDVVYTNLTDGERWAYEDAFGVS